MMLKRKLTVSIPAPASPVYLAISPTYSSTSPKLSEIDYAQAPKRVKWEMSLKEECEKAMETIQTEGHPTKLYTAMRLVAKVLLHVTNKTQNTSAGMHSIEMMRVILNTVDVV
jgi:hypothetical protein